MPGRTRGSAHASHLQTLVDYLVAQGDSDAVVLDFARIKALTGYPLTLSMHTGGSTWTSATAAPVRRWRAVGWRARLDIKGRRVHFTRDAEVGDG